MKRQTVISGAAPAYEDPSQTVPAIKEGAPGPVEPRPPETRPLNRSPDLTHPVGPDVNHRG
jgi:hypothetical protein